MNTEISDIIRDAEYVAENSMLQHNENYGAGFISKYEYAKAIIAVGEEVRKLLAPHFSEATVDELINKIVN